MFLQDKKFNLRTKPTNSATILIFPSSLVNPCQDIFFAARSVDMKISPFIVENAMYRISGPIQQFVCPYIVSGLKVAATKNTGVLSEMNLKILKMLYCHFATFFYLEITH